MSAHERERLSAYLNGELPAGERAAVEAHLGACPACAAFLARLAAVDEAAASLPAEAPSGYFESFPGRVRARIEPRGAGLPARRLPAWTWAAAAALLLAVITPLTLLRVRPGGEASPAATTEEQRAPERAEPKIAAKDDRSDTQPALSKAQPMSPPFPGPRATPPAALPPAAQAPAVVPPPAPEGPAVAPPVAAVPAPHAPPVSGAARAESSRDAAPRGSRDEAAEGFFVPEPGAPEPREQAVTRQEAPVDAESQAAAAGSSSEDAVRRDKRAGAAPRPGVTAESTSPALAASAERQPTLASVERPADAFRRLDAARPRTAAGWRRVHQQWKALAASDTDLDRADEARVRAIIAAREAWQLGGDEDDEAVFRAEAESYLGREDARQRARVEGLVTEAAPWP